MTTPAVCSRDGVQAIGVCQSCSQPFCATHQARRDTDDYLLGGARWISYPDTCADCLRARDQQKVAERENAIAEKSKRDAWVAGLPPLTPAALTAHVRRQTDEDDGVLTLGGQSYAFTADPMCVITVLQQSGYPGPFRHSAELGPSGRVKRRKFTGWAVLHESSYTSQDNLVHSVRGFVLTTELVFRLLAGLSWARTAGEG